MNDTLSKALEINRKSILATYEMSRKLNGVECQIFKPIPATRSIFGVEDIVARDGDDLDIFQEFLPQQLPKIETPEETPENPDEEIILEEEAKPIKLLFKDLFVKGSLGGNTAFDTFSSNPIVITTVEETLPIQTRIHIDFNGMTMDYSVQTHQNPTPHIQTQLLVYHLLCPAT